MVRVRGARRRTDRRAVAVVALALMLTGLAIPAGADDVPPPPSDPVPSPAVGDPDPGEDIPDVGTDDEDGTGGPDTDLRDSGDVPPPAGDPAASPPQLLESLSADDPDTQIITVDGIVRTIAEDFYLDHVNAGQFFVVDADGVLLPIPPTDAEALSDRQAASVTILAPVDMPVADAIASAGGAVPGDEAVVLAVAPVGEAPVRTGPDDPDGLHTVTVLPISWEEGAGWGEFTTSWATHYISQRLPVFEDASGGRFTSTVTVREPVVLPGHPTCDPVRQYNEAMRANDEAAPEDAHEHIAVIPRSEGLDCDTWYAVLGGSQLWLREESLGHSFGHSLGHNLGLGHAGIVQDCPDAIGVLPAAVDCLGHPALADWYSVMGYRSATKLHEPFAEALGWGSSVTATPGAVLAATVGGDSPPTVRAVRIPMLDGSYLYAEAHVVYGGVVEFRRLYWSDGVPHTELLGLIGRGAVRLIEGSDYAVSLDGSNPPVLRVAHRSLDTAPPTAPVITSPEEGEGVDTHNLGVEWDAAVDSGLGVVGYRLIIDGRFDSDWVDAAKWVSIPSHSGPPEHALLRSVIVVQAVDAAGNATSSAPIVVKIPGRPFPPTDLAVVTGYASVHATWGDLETYPDADSYFAELFLGEDWYDRRQVEPETRSASFFGLPPRSDYVFKVSGTNGYGLGSPATLPFVIDPPTATAVATVTGMTSPVTISWSLGHTTAVAPEAMHVTVDDSDPVTTPGDATSVAIPLGPGTHDVIVSAVDPWGDTVRSEPVTVTVPGIEATGPAGPTTSPATLTWDVHPDLTGQVAHLLISIDDSPIRRVGPATSSVALPLRPGTTEATVTAVGYDGSVLAVDAVEVVVSEAAHLFADVPFNHTFANDILWLAQTGATTGYADGSFRPGGAVTRGQMAAFLYRYAGAELALYVPPTDARFGDVPRGHPFYTEISWLADNGVAGGYADGTFRPSRAITRGQMAAFLYRFADAQHTRPSSPPFSDVPTEHSFATAISWLAASGVTGGYADGTFRPSWTVTRGQMAAFLHRMDG